MHRSIAEYTGMRTVKAHYPDLARQKSYTQDEVLNAHIVSDWHLGCGTNPFACPVTFSNVGFGRLAVPRPLPLPRVRIRTVTCVLSPARHLCPTHAQVSPA